MNRMEMIARLAGRKTAAPTTKPAGLYASANPDERATRKKPFDRTTRPKRGARWGWYGAEIGHPEHRRKQWLGAPDERDADWRPEFRKGKHWLTRVAEGWRR